MTDKIQVTIEEFEEENYHQYVTFMTSLGIVSLSKNKYLEILRTNPIAHEVYHKNFDICSYTLINTEKINVVKEELEKYR